MGSLREFLISSVYTVLVGSTGAVPLSNVHKVLASSVLGCTSIDVCSSVVCACSSGPSGRSGACSSG